MGPELTLREYKKRQLHEALAEKDLLKFHLYGAVYGRGGTSQETIDKMAEALWTVRDRVARLHREVHGREYSIFSHFEGLDSSAQLL